MKKNIVTLSIFLCIGLYAFGQNVEVAEAENVAKSFLALQNTKVQKNNLSISENSTVFNEYGEALYHIFNFENGGFVIVSGDKRTEPILAYSTTNNYAIDNNSNPASSFWLESNYAQPISALKRENASTDVEILQKWQAIASGKMHKSYANKVDPLVTAKWNQDKYYNALCPEDAASPNGYDYHVPNGCVAVAVGQIMYYHRYPRQGSGSNSYSSNYGYLSANFGATNYNYEAMADVATGYSDAIARLIFHIGVAVKMNYAPKASGATTENVTSILVNNFRYDANSMKYLERKNFTDAKWLDTIKYSLSMGLPIYYAAESQVGGDHARHAFVCDGYDEYDKVHINWGWGGSSSDGFYAITHMGPDEYIHDNRIIIGIKPVDSTLNFFTGTDTLTATYGSFNDGSGYLPYRSNTNCSWLISPQGGRYINSIVLNVSAFSLGDGDSVYIYEGNSASGTLVAALGGEVSPGITYPISTSEAFVVFNSDNDGIEGNGFTFTYTTTRDASTYCPASSSIPVANKKTDNIGSIDNGVPAGTDYVSENSCYWAIAPQMATNKVELVFTKFDLEYGDFVEFHTFPVSSPVQAGNWRYTSSGVYRFSKDNLPVIGRKYAVNTATALVYFRTDNDKTASGFEITWDATPPGISENDLNLNQLSVFPNPSSDAVNVNFTVDGTENIQISLLDVLGKTVYSTPQTEIMGQYSEKIDISNFAKGIYLLKINTTKGSITKKVVVD